MTKSGLLLSACVFLVLFCFAPHTKAYTKPGPDILLHIPEDLREDAFFERVVQNCPAGTTCEQDKIDYLLEKIRRSPFTFIRNGISGDGIDASRHLKWKCLRKCKKKNIDGAEDYIKRIASRSDMSGEYYWMTLDDGRTYRMGDVLTNELNRLEKSLRT